jgi:hypothetical protein
MAIEDQRTAVGFSVTLSAALIASSMALLGLEAAYVWYALGSRLTRSGFTFFAGLAALMIVISIMRAGKGITKARNAGFAGNWDLKEGKKDFNKQAIFLLCALLSLVVMFCLSGQSKESALERKVEDLRSEVALMHGELEKQPALQDATKKEVADQLRQITTQIEALRAQLPAAKKPKPAVPPGH